jgi:hypothetical protein
MNIFQLPVFQRRKVRPQSSSRQSTGQANDSSVGNANVEAPSLPLSPEHATEQVRILSALTPDRFERKRHFPTAESALDMLPWTRVLPCDKQAFQHDDTECSICCERLIDGFAITRLPCGHLFHYMCALSWLGRSNSCPDCRYELPTTSRRQERGRRERMKSRHVAQCNCQVSHMHQCFFVDTARRLNDQVCSEIRA